MNLRTTAYKKYLFYLNNFATRKKLLNILENRREFKNTEVALKSHPFKITLDPGNICNLRCPGCHTGIKHPDMTKPSFMRFDDFKTMFEQVKDYALSIALYNWGEPFLNKQLFDMIAHASENRVGTTLHSNFNHFNEKMAEEVIKSKLTHLYLSIDGASQEIYSAYRVKGDIEQVKENIKLMVAMKKKTGSRLPYITWKYLKFPHNAMEVVEAKQMAHEIGVDNFEVFDANPKVRDIYDQAVEYRDNPVLLNNLKTNCKSLWSSIYIGPDGTVFPCSLAFRDKESFGNLLSNDFMQIWNSEKYQSGRRMFTKNPGFENVPYPCKGCKYYLRCQRNN